MEQWDHVLGRDNNCHKREEEEWVSNPILELTIVILFQKDQ